jgi:thiol-disulfide isomerase/thioredoxin
MILSEIKELRAWQVREYKNFRFIIKNVDSICSVIPYCSTGFQGAWSERYIGEKDGDFQSYASAIQNGTPSEEDLRDLTIIRECFKGSFGCLSDETKIIGVIGINYDVKEFVDSRTFATSHVSRGYKLIETSKEICGLTFPEQDEEFKIDDVIKHKEPYGSIDGVVVEKTCGRCKAYFPSNKEIREVNNNDKKIGILDVNYELINDKSFYRVKKIAKRKL